MRYAGIDVSKNELSTTILDQDGTEITYLETTNTATGWTKLTDRLEEADLIGVEASTYTYPLAEHLVREGYEVHMGHPTRIHQLIKSDTKTDRKDSWHLADLLRMDRYPLCFHPDPDLFRARDLIRRRIDKGEEAARLKTQIRSLLGRYGLKPPKSLWKGPGIAWLQQDHFDDERNTLLQIHVESLVRAEEHKERLDTELARLALHREDVRCLMTIEGINYYTALLIVLETGPLERFDSIGAFRAYAGAAPRVAQSGDVERVTPHRSAFNRRLKWALGLATDTLIRSRRDNPVKAYYEKQKAKTPTTQQAKGRARGKLTNIVYAVLRKREPCRWADPAQVERKLAKMRWHADRRNGASA